MKGSFTGLFSQLNFKHALLVWTMLAIGLACSPRSKKKPTIGIPPADQQEEMVDDLIDSEVQEDEDFLTDSDSTEEPEYENYVDFTGSSDSEDSETEESEEDDTTSDLFNDDESTSEESEDKYAFLDDEESTSDDTDNKVIVNADSFSDDEELQALMNNTGYTDSSGEKKSGNKLLTGTAIVITGAAATCIATFYATKKNVNCAKYFQDSQVGQWFQKNINKVSKAMFSTVADADVLINTLKKGDVADTEALFKKLFVNNKHLKNHLSLIGKLEADALANGLKGDRVTKQAIALATKDMDESTFNALMAVGDDAILAALANNRWVLSNTNLRAKLEASTSPNAKEIVEEAAVKWAEAFQKAKDNGKGVDEAIEYFPQDQLDAIMFWATK